MLESSSSKILMETDSDKKCIFCSGLRIPFKTIRPTYNKNVLNSVAFHLCSSSSPLGCRADSEGINPVMLFNLSEIWLILRGTNLNGLGPSFQNNNSLFITPKQTKCI